MHQDYEFDIGHLKRFSFREMQTATSNFSPKNILGQGGFGVVYKGSHWAFAALNTAIKLIKKNK